MGILLDTVLSDKNLVAEFICGICCELVEYPAYTVCTHVFCKTCLQEWRNNNPSCPSCKTDLYDDRTVGDLKTACPLAWRVLGKVQCKCPLASQGCSWVGDYSEISSHLTNSESHSSEQQGLAASRAKASAEALKEQGNQKFEQRAYPDAITLYTKAISFAPKEPKYYGNRAATLMMMGRYRDCIADCETAVGLDPSFSKGHVRTAKALVELGEIDNAVAYLTKVMQAQRLGDVDKELQHCLQMQQWMQAGNEAHELGNFSLASNFYGTLLKHTHTPIVVLKMVRTELGMGKCDRALRMSRDVIKSDSQNAEAYTVRGTALFYNGDFDQGQLHMKEALRLDPDFNEAARMVKRIKRVQKASGEAQQAAFSRDFENATKLYTAALDGAQAPEHAPLSANLHAERANARLRLREYQECLKDCAIAIYALEDCKAAWLTKANALHALGRHQEALNDMTQLYEVHQGDTQIQHAYQRAQFEVRKLHRVDYYDVLQCGRTSSIPEIKFAYKQRALEWHPDKHEGARRKEAEEKFKVIGEALEILGDEMKRKLYDEGYDKEAIEERVQAAERAAKSHNKDGCCAHAH